MKKFKEVRLNSTDKEGELLATCWMEEQPVIDQPDITSQYYAAQLQAVSDWEESGEQRMVHPDFVEAFKDIVRKEFSVRKDKTFISINEYLKQGVFISPDGVYIKPFKGVVDITFIDYAILIHQDKEEGVANDYVEFGKWLKHLDRFIDGGKTIEELYTIFKSLDKK